MGSPTRRTDSQPKATELAVILAAGEGTRLSPHHGAVPKPALALLGMSLGERVIVSCIEAGIGSFVVVLGHREEVVRAHFETIASRRGCKVDFVTARDWKLGNGASALAASAAVADAPFVLLMSDHMILPSTVRAVLATELREGEICLAVDRDKEGIFDLDDVTKVKFEEDRVTRLGKTLEPWDGGDTGVFRCTSAIFEALRAASARGEHALTDGVNELARSGSVVAVDVTGQTWLDVDTPEAFREAKRRLLGSLTKPHEDGYIAQYINRPISTRLSARLVSSSVTPDQITLFSFVVSLAGAGCFGLGGYGIGVLGALLVQFASIVDGCDGEVARLKHLASPRGGWLDTILDRYSDLAVTIAVTYAYGAVHPGALIWIGGLLAATGFILTSYATKEFALRHGYPYPFGWLVRFVKRDLRLFIICGGAVIAQPYIALMAIGIFSHLCVFGILASGWVTSGTRPSPKSGPGE